MMDLSWLGPAISASASHINTGVNVLWEKERQREANEANERIAAATNEANRQINESQLAWARENYELEKAENQRLLEQSRAWDLDYNARLQAMRRAGLNPFLSESGHLASGGSNQGVGSPPKVSQPNMIPMQGYGYMPGPSLNLPTDMSDFAGLFQLAYNREVLDQKWVDILKDTNLDPETKNKIIKDRLFHSDRRTDAEAAILDNKLETFKNEAILSAAKVAIANEENEQKRKEWEYINKHHKNELQFMANKLADYVLEHHILENESNISDKQFDILKYHADKIARENDIFSGNNFTWQGFWEMLRSIFSDGSLMNTLLLLRRK